MTCFGCGRIPGADGICERCREVFDHDGDSWTFKDAASEALRKKINAARTELKYEYLAEGGRLARWRAREHAKREEAEDG